MGEGRVVAMRMASAIVVAGCLAVIGGWSTGVSTLSLPTARNGRAGAGDSGAGGVGRGRESEIVAAASNREQEGPMQISGLFKLRRIRLQCH